jgi:hypothetical protein
VFEASGDFYDFEMLQFPVPVQMPYNIQISFFFLSYIDNYKMYTVALICLLCVSGVGGKICTDTDSIAVTANKNESQVIFKVDRTHETTIVQDLRAESCMCGGKDVREQLDELTRKLDALLAKTPGRLEGLVLRRCFKLITDHCNVQMWCFWDNLGGS